MTTSGYLQEDDLILYAMQALSEDEASSVRLQLAESVPMRRRLADIQQTLGTYAEAVTDPVQVPAGSLERLVASLPRTYREAAANLPGPTNVMPMQRKPVTDVDAHMKKSAGPSILGWAGWAVAAAALVTLGVEYRHKAAAEHLLTAQDSRLQEQGSKLQQANVQLQEKLVIETNLAAQREALMQTLQDTEKRTQTARAELSTYKDQSAALSAKVAAESARAQRESARASDLASIAEERARESDRLKGTLASQQEQVAQLNAQAANARQVLDALSDPTALRVTLTVPKQKQTPTGRGTYVPNRGTLLFTASNLAPLPANRVYQLWLMPATGAPIPAGTFVPDASGNATLVSTGFQRQVAAKGFAVTAEPTGGSQTPTMPILLVAL